MSEIENEMNKYASLIQKECLTISNTFNKLSELYKQMNRFLKKKRKNSDEILQKEKEKENVYDIIKINNDLNDKIIENKEDNNNEINKTTNISENDIIKNSQRGFTKRTFNENSETILKRGLIKSKILNQLKYDGVEGKMINGFKILVIFGDYEYYFGPYKSKNFAFDLKNIILNKLDQVSNKWGNCRKLTQEQQDSLSNIFKEIEIAVEEFFNKENNNNNNNNNSTNESNNSVINNNVETSFENNNNNNNNEILEKKNIEEQNKDKNIINNEKEEIKQNENIETKGKEEKKEDMQNNENNSKVNEEKNDKNSPIKPNQTKSKKIIMKNIVNNSINSNIEKNENVIPNNLIKESNEKSIKKELNILHYLNDDDYENDNQNQLKKE